MILAEDERMAKCKRGRRLCLAFFTLELRRSRGSRRQMNERHQLIAIYDEPSATAPPRDHVICMLRVFISGPKSIRHAVARSWPNAGREPDRLHAFLWGCLGPIRLCSLRRTNE